MLAYRRYPAFEEKPFHQRQQAYPWSIKDSPRGREKTIHFHYADFGIVLSPINDAFWIHLISQKPEAEKVQEFMRITDERLIIPTLIVKGYEYDTLRTADGIAM